MLKGLAYGGIGRVSKRANNTVVNIVHAVSQKAQLVHNEEVQTVETEQVIADEMWSFVKKAKTLYRYRNKGWRLLDWVEFSKSEWVDFECLCGQTHR